MTEDIKERRPASGRNTHFVIIRNPVTTLKFFRNIPTGALKFPVSMFVGEHTKYRAKYHEIPTRVP